MDNVGQIIATILVIILELVATYYIGRALITYGINYYFDIIDYRAKELAKIKERLRRADIDADIRRINRELDEIEKQNKEKPRP